MKIYTFLFKKIYEDGRPWTRHKYQIPSDSRDKALIALGRNFHREDYEIHLIEESSLPYPKFSSEE